MKREEVERVMEKFGFINGRVTTTGETYQIGYWVYPKRNKKDERLGIEVNSCYNTENPHSLPVLWHKNGWTKELILNYWHIRHYVYDKDGNCYGKYDYVKNSEDGKRYVIDFDWVMENTIENLEKLIAESLRRFNA